MERSRWKEAARAARKQIRGSLSPCSPSSPPQTPAPSCGCSLPSPKYCPGCRPRALLPPGARCQRQISMAAPVPVSPSSPHHWSRDSPLQSFSPGWIQSPKEEGKSSKTAINTCRIAQALSPPRHLRDLKLGDHLRYPHLPFSTG